MVKKSLNLEGFYAPTPFKGVAALLKGADNFDSRAYEKPRSLRVGSVVSSHRSAHP